MKLFLVKSQPISLGLQQKEAPTPAYVIPPPRVLSRECRKEISIFFSHKDRLRAIVSLEVLRQCSWEVHLWPVLSPWVPDPETTEEADRRKREGRPRTGKTVHPPPAPNALGCVSWKFIEAQIEKVRAVIDSALTVDELITRIEQEVEIL